MTFDPTSVKVPYVTLPKYHYAQDLYANASEYLDTATKNSMTPNNTYMTFDPTFVEVTYAILPEDYCVKRP